MQEIMRTKRSSAQAVSAVVSKASSGLQSKLGLLGQASAGIIAGASSKTSGGDEHHGYSYEPVRKKNLKSKQFIKDLLQHDDKVDYWGLKKSILNTLFQAVKAITGGVTILKGQLIKGGGALAATLGKVISVKGDAVSNLGKKIVSSAALSPPKKQHCIYLCSRRWGPPEVRVTSEQTDPRNSRSRSRRLRFPRYVQQNNRITAVASSHVPVYGPPPLTHDFPPTAYGPPTAPAHFAHTAPTAHAAPSGFASHKYPAHFDGKRCGRILRVTVSSLLSLHEFPF
ncbi:hypothetical protein EVAR_20431_1 [Eumeta japonica]|uniref:Uncharacterized protein n=1 Tax=Eumeta variegata TaxID=151549 RepID=A0A4C1TXX3_EUMVA|nr:hypothetical protein EVAR_20431_1 [Eumeta japonica]